MKEKLNKILVDLGYSETEDLVWTKEIEQKSPDQTMVINGQQVVQPGQVFKVIRKVSALLNNFWLDDKDNPIEPGFYFIQFEIIGPDGNGQKTNYEMFNIDELDKLKEILQ